MFSDKYQMGVGDFFPGSLQSLIRRAAYSYVRKAEMTLLESCPHTGNAPTLWYGCFGFFCVCLQVRQVFNLTNSKRIAENVRANMDTLSCLELRYRKISSRFDSGISPPKPFRLYIAVTWTGTAEMLSADFILKGALLFAYPEKTPTGGISVGTESAQSINVRAFLKELARVVERFTLARA